MSAVTDFVEDTVDFVGDVVEGVGDVISDVADVAFDIVEDVGSFVGDTIERAIDNPIGTIAQVAAVATGNAWALPLISAGDVIVHGGDLEDAVKAAGMTYIAQGVVNYAATEIGNASNFVDYGGPIEYTEGMFNGGGTFSSLENSYYGSGGGDYGTGIGDYYGDYDTSSNSFFEPRGGGAVDLGVNPDTGAVRMDFTGMADSAGDVYSPGDLDFGPGANTVPSGGVYDILDQNPYVPPEIFDVPVNDYPPLEVTPGPLPDWYTNPATDLPSTDLDFPPSVVPEAPYDPYADQGPSTTNPNVVTPDATVPDLGEVIITDDRPVTPVIPDLGEVVITDTRPPLTPVVPEPEVPEIVITDDRPPPPPPEPPVVLPPVVPDLPIVDPEPEVPEIVITDDRPVTPVVPEPEVPEIVIVDDRPPPETPEPPVVLPPVVLDPPIIDPEPEVPEIVIVDDRPPPEPPEPPVVLPPVVPEPPIVDPEPPVVPPVVEPPWVPPIIVVPPIPPDPPVTPPYVPPTPPQLPPRTFGGGLNPGFIQPTAFYNTTNPNQSKFFWGGHGYQAGPTFNQQQYNQVAAPVTPWGLQGQAQPLTGQQISNVVQGQPLVQAPVAPATRVEQYRPDYRTPPSYGQIQLNPQYGGSAATPAATAMSIAPEMSTAPAQFTAGPTSGNMDQVSAQLGPNWFNKQQASAAAGDWDTYYQIQKQVDNIMYQPMAKPGKFESTK